MSRRRLSLSPPPAVMVRTELQVAAGEDNLKRVKELIIEGYDLDEGPEPALHTALKRGHLDVAFALLRAGANCEIRDANGNYPIHIASSLGQYEVVQHLCAFGCNVDVVNGRGLYPLHMAAKNGHINIVRCLCAAGCNMDARNADNIRADITALKHGHNDIAELLDRVKSSSHRDHLARQLVPQAKPAGTRVSLRLLGHSGVGKTSIAKSLTAGLFSQLFRRSGSSQSNKSRPSSPIGSHIEMDVTSRQNSLTFEHHVNYNSTKGINVQHADISNTGDVMIWDFSGQESYFPLYNNFLAPSPASLTAILFNLEDPPMIQLQQICFWLNFLTARQPPEVPAEECGLIILTATHVDLTRAGKSAQGEWISPEAQKTYCTVRDMFPHITNFHPTVLALDCNVPASFSFKQIKALLASVKQDCLLKSNASWTGILEHTLNWLPHARKDFESYPVVTMLKFYALIRSQVNILASDEHIKELLFQLQAMGEVFSIGGFVILNVQWLCSDLFGELLSVHFLNHTRVTGVYTVEDFQAAFTQYDASDLLNLLEAFKLCIKCEVDEDIEFEFPCFNKMETVSGLWDLSEPQFRTPNVCYGGLRFYTPADTYYMFSSIFYYLQVELRRATSDYLGSDSDIDLYQWRHGSKLSSGPVEGMVTLQKEDDLGIDFIEIKIRGVEGSGRDCFFMMQDIVGVINETIYSICPGIVVEQYALSSKQLRIHCTEPFCFAPNVINQEVLNAESIPDLAFVNPDTQQSESLLQLLLFECSDMVNKVQWGCSLSVAALPTSAKKLLCGLLDPPEPHGCDWCVLALRLGMEQENIAALDDVETNQAMQMLQMLKCSIGALVSSLLDLDRKDAAEVVLRTTPLLQTLQPPDSLVTLSTP